MRSSRSGFTLLEVLVATVIMGLAVAGLVAGLSQSVKNASRLNDYAVLHSLKARLVDAMAPVMPMIRRTPVSEGPGSAMPE